MSPNPCKFLKFEAMDDTKPYEFVWFGAMDVTKPYEFIGFGAMDVTKPKLWGNLLWGGLRGGAPTIEVVFALAKYAHQC